MGDGAKHRHSSGWRHLDDGGHPTLLAARDEHNHLGGSNPANTYVTPMAKWRTGVEVKGTHEGGTNVQVARPLSMSERMVVLAAVISIDFDYFSRHSSNRSGSGMPFFFPFSIFGGRGDDDDGDFDS